MSTTASIIFHDGLNTWANDVNFDGYPAGVGRVLVEHYVARETIGPMVHGGSLSLLAPISGYPATDSTDAQKEELARLLEGHAWGSRERWGVSVYYHRDRKESWDVCKYRTYNSIAEAISGESQNYVYLWFNEEWYLVNWHPLRKGLDHLAEQATSLGIPVKAFLQDSVYQAGPGLTAP